MNRRSNSPIILGIVLLAIGGLFFYTGISEKMRLARLESEGVSTPGKIVEAHVRSGQKGRKTYYLSVDWDAGTERKNGDSFSVTRLFYNSRIGNGGSISDSSVTVRYVPSDPDSAIIVGGRPEMEGIRWVGLILMIIGGLIITVRILRRIVGR